MRFLFRLTLHLSLMAFRWGQVSSAALYLVPPGKSTTLPCNITFFSEIMWFRQRAENMTLLTVTSKEKLSNDTTTEFFDGDRNLDVKEDNVTGSFSLIIEEAKESDLGLYYCAQSERGGVRFGKGVRLDFAGVSTERPFPVCWSLLIAMIPVAALLSAVAVHFLHRCGDHRAFTCNSCMRGMKTMKTADLQYASLQLTRKTVPPVQTRDLTPAPIPVIYSSVANHGTTNNRPDSLKVTRLS